QAARAYPAFHIDGARFFPIRNDERATAFTQIFVWYRHHRRIEHLRVRQQMIFDFLGRDLLAGTVDVIVGPALNRQIPIRRTLYDVAGTVVAVLGERTRIGRRVVVIGADRVWPARQQIAW